MVLEKSVEDWVTTYADEAGGKAIKITGYTGFPDRLILLPGGRVAMAETKKPVGGRLAKAQKLRIAMLNRLGFKVYVPCTKQDVERMFEEL